jgi:iron complex transport system substrate-binding protein
MQRLSFPSLIAILLVVAVAGLGLGACASSLATPTPRPTTYTDGLGNTITLYGPAKRVVSLAPSNTEILFAIQGAYQTVGRDQFSDYPPEAKNVPSIGGDSGKFNNEAIVNLHPDLVLASELNTPEQVKALQDLGLTVYYLANPKDMDGLYANITTVGELTGHQSQAKQLVDSLKVRVAAVDQKIKGASEQPTVFYELDSTVQDAPYTAGPGSFIDTLIGMAGGKNVADPNGPAWAQLSLEQIVVLDPNIILLGDAAYGATPVDQRPGWGGLSAVKNGKVYAFDDNLVSRPGPRLVDGLETLAKLLHPESFQ